MNAYLEEQNCVIDTLRKICPSCILANLLRAKFYTSQQERNTNLKHDLDL